MSAAKPWLPPRWVKRLAWFTHRRVYRRTGGRLGLWRPKPDGWGAMRLTTVGRRTGLERSVILGYFEDGPNLVTMAMNGWEAEEPAWWLNLQAHPDARVDLTDGPRLVTGRAAARRGARPAVVPVAGDRQAPGRLRGAPARPRPRSSSSSRVLHRATTVRAAVYDRYGPPEVLRVEDVPTPSPAAGQVLVRVAATSINLSDWETLRGSPAVLADRRTALAGPPHAGIGHRRVGGGRRRGRHPVPAR